MSAFEQITSVFNNREIATIVWSLLLLVWVLIKSKDFYRNLWGLLVSIVGLWKYFLLMIAYVSASIAVLYKFDVWHVGLLKITIFWFFGWAVVLFVNSPKIGNEKGYLKKVIAELLGLAVVISFISNFYSFALWIELFLVPFIALLAGMAAVSAHDVKYKSTSSFVNGALVFFGLVIFGSSLYKTIVGFGDFATLETLKEFSLPILLSLMFIPFGYLMSAYSRWEQKRIRDSNLNNRL